MRLDKFLKVSRIIKRRQIAKEMADQGRVLVNDKVAKSSTKINVDDVIMVKFGQKELVVKVLALLDSTKKEDANQMYQIISENRING